MNYINIIWAALKISISLFCDQKQAIRIIFEDRFSHTKIFHAIRFHNLYTLKPTKKYLLQTDNLASMHLKRINFGHFSISFRCPYLWSKIDWKSWFFFSKWHYSVLLRHPKFQSFLLVKLIKIIEKIIFFFAWNIFFINFYWVSKIDLQVLFSLQKFAKLLLYIDIVNIVLA